MSDYVTLTAPPPPPPQRYTFQLRIFPTMTSLNEVDRESVRKRVWVSKWAVTSSQELPNTGTSGHCRYSRG